MSTISYTSLVSQSTPVTPQAANNQNIPTVDLAFLLEIDLRLGRRKQFLKRLHAALGFLESNKQEMEAGSMPTEKQGTAKLSH